MTVKSYELCFDSFFFFLGMAKEVSSHCPGGQQSPLPLVSLGPTVVLQRVLKRNTAPLNEMAVEVRLAIKGHTALQLNED